MPLFKKAKKKSPKQKYCENLMEQITFATLCGEHSVYIAATEEQENWLYEFANFRGYKARLSHSTDGEKFFKIWGWT